ncbi:toxin co-regulated pilus biosynthesis Q family protein [Paraburkholderia sp. BR10872]|uniref:toxin co-regulated pilus biosynthesis Q family protein n=1 Tax=Paraburkholderia sp. BR10872 TaxID=3236989 RepID=UPI0034D22B30
MKNSKRVAAALPGAFALCMGTASVAHAGFVNETAPVAAAVPAAQPLTLSMNTPAVTPPVAASLQPAQPAQASKAADGNAVAGVPPVIGEGAHVTQIGFHPADVTMPRGKGHDIALSDMLPVVVPHDYHVDLGNVDPTLLVNWSGGLPWDTVLTNAVSSLPGVHVTFDWDRHLVNFHRGPKGGAPMPPTVALASNGPAGLPASPTADHKDVPANPHGEIAPEAPAAQLPGPEAAPSAETYVLLGGQSLETQLMGWAKRAGWSVSWNTADDWIVPHDLSYHSNFEDAINSVFTQLASNGADVRADIWRGNKAVVVDKAGVNQ